MFLMKLLALIFPVTLKQVVNDTRRLISRYTLLELYLLASQNVHIYLTYSAFVSINFKMNQFNGLTLQGTETKFIIIFTDINICKYNALSSVPSSV
jgi:hypothetical protein